jgi:hypothetical protein
MGMDVIVPASQGLMRLAVWYAVEKKEAMLEVRLL